MLHTFVNTRGIPLVLTKVCNTEEQWIDQDATHRVPSLMFNRSVDSLSRFSVTVKVGMLTQLLQDTKARIITVNVMSEIRTYILSVT